MYLVGPKIEIGEGWEGVGTGVRVWRSVVRPGDTVVDATAGNGKDTAFMASLALGAHGEGLVVAVDVQQAAIDSTRQHLERNLDETCLRSVRYHCLCHSNLDALLPDASAALVAFNLGYLPGGAKELTTTATSTLAAVEASCRLLKPGGLISLVVYVGHPGAR